MPTRPRNLTKSFVCAVVSFVRSGSRSQPTISFKTGISMPKYGCRLSNEQILSTVSVKFLQLGEEVDPPWHQKQSFDR